MGWSYSQFWRSRNDVVEYLRRPERFQGRQLMLQSALVGNHHWYLAKGVDEGPAWIGLDLLAGSGRLNQGWGYKSLSEAQQPFETDCPLALLNRAGPPCERAAAWRALVREYHVQKAQRRRPEHGLVVRLGAHRYELLRNLGGRKGWMVLRLPDRTSFRMTGRQLATALHNLPPAITPAKQAQPVQGDLF
ncbi:hypothetical protein [Rugamonas aquatica]|uniref:Uncharacterized protein n=1 Tax=Rugamonas aquatica TaxID=2743357 RepID=A0A6A7N681_9BURK|nr:hypothetical protein [Rugamonas aquatica]MQA40635.1 hypothetical protein [Rugamonas aquatica]